MKEWYILLKYYIRLKKKYIILFLDNEESDDMEEIIVLNKEGKQVEKNLSK